MKDQKDKIIADYFANLPQMQIDEVMQERLVAMGQREVARRVEAHFERRGAWIVVGTIVAIFGLAYAILQIMGVDLSEWISAMKVERATPSVIDQGAVAAFWSWALLGVMALAMLVGYTFLIRRYESRHDSKQ